MDTRINDLLVELKEEYAFLVKQALSATDLQTFNQKDKQAKHLLEIITLLEQLPKAQ